MSGNTIQRTPAGDDAIIDVQSLDVVLTVAGVRKQHAVPEDAEREDVQLYDEDGEEDGHGIKTDAVCGREVTFLYEHDSYVESGICADCLAKLESQEADS